MIRKAYLPILLLLTICFCSCSKEDNNPPVSQDDLVKIYTEDVFDGSGQPYNTKDSFSLSYDSDNRIVSIISFLNSGNKILYSYPQNNLFNADVYESNELTLHSICYLNSFQLLDSIYSTNNTNDTNTTKFIYNPAKQLIRTIDYSYTTAGGYEMDDITNFEYNPDGSLLKQTDNSMVTTYEYYPDLKSNLTNFFQPYYPISDKLAKRVVVDLGGGFTIGVNSKYTFDDKNRLIQEEGQDDSGSYKYTKRYYY